MEMASVLEVEKAAERGTIGKFLDDMTSMYAIGYNFAPCLQLTTVI
jgi:hypothetical protein